MSRMPSRRLSILLSSVVLFMVTISALNLVRHSITKARSAVTITVNTNADDNASNGNCTLREAILAANTDAAVDGCAAGSGTDTIAFAIPGAGPQTIAPTTPLPEITAPVVIDGTTQSGASCTATGGLKIELNGENSGSAGLIITSGGSTIKGLVINRFPSAGVILSGSSGNTLSCNYIGTNVAGDAAQGNADFGVYLANSANNLIGGTTAGAGNLISGNAGNGVQINFAPSTNNRVQGNFIGTNATGTAAIGNGSGVGVAESATNNLIGGAAPGEGNLISGNQAHGVGLVVNSSGNQVQGNRIGTDVSGTLGLGNGARGVFINTSTNNLIGGTTAGAHNLISGNASEGIMLEGSDASGNRIEGNTIGLNLSGTAAIANAGLAIWLTNAPNNTIGGTAAGARNVISGNSQSGIVIGGAAATGNLVQGNYIGTNAAGTAGLGNAHSGIIITDSPGNTVGGTAAGAGNLISGNGDKGLYLGSANNTVQGNVIGTNAAGTADLGNQGTGIELGVGATNNLIGGPTVVARNLISGNDSYGIAIGSASGNTVQQNYIGTDVTGALNLGNRLTGVIINDGANNLIGGSGAGNVISGNDNGVVVSGVTATGNQVLSNYIGTNAAGTAALGNVLQGVVIFQATSTQISGNLVSGNGLDGIQLLQAGISNTQIQGNLIGTDISGMFDLGNGGRGIYVESSSNLTIGGTSSGARNLISGNNGRGIHLRLPQSTNITVQGNYIGTNAAGTAALGNNEYGIVIEDAPNNLIGGTATGARNLISGNIGSGVLITAGATGNQVLGNYIGVNVSGTAALGNNDNGIAIIANDSIIGGAAPGAGNVISANRKGIVIDGPTNTGTQILGNFIGTNATGTAALGNLEIGIEFGGDNTVIGGTTPGAGNLISGNGGVGIQGGGNNATIQGNYIGTDVTGTVALPHAREGIFLSSSNSLIGGTTAAARNLISGNSGSGIGLAFTSTNTHVQGNYIGTNAAGTAALPNGAGVVITEGANGNFIGGTTAGARNVISGNTGAGVTFYIRGNNNTVQGNFIGVNATGAGALPNGGSGVHAIISSGNTIGGTVAGAANRIAYNGQSGVLITDDPVNPSVNNRILANEIFANGLFGIDLGAFGVNANDGDDGDSGPNNLQNFPVLNPITAAGTVSGSFDSTVANSAYPVRLDFYANTACDASGNGEGEVYLGAISLTGPATLFSFSYTPVPGKGFITATATDANGNTSEFSNCAAPNQPPTIFPNNINATVALGTTGFVSPTYLGAISDPDLPNETLTVKVNNAAAATVNGVTVALFSQPPPMNVQVAAFITADCNATAASFTLTVSDSVGNTGTATLNVGVSANTPPTTFSYNAPLPVGTGGAATINLASPPTDNGTISYAVQSVTGANTFTGNISVNTSGVVSVSNARPAGTYTVTIRATDNCAAFTEASFPLVISCSTLTISPTMANLPPTFGLVGQSYSYGNFFAFGGTTPYTFSATNLPPGLAMVQVSGQWRITGTPTAPGSYNFMVTASDSSNCTSTANYTVVIHSQTPSIVVTTTADENNTNPAACSLREALVAANTNLAFGGCAAGLLGYDTITFALPSASTYRITLAAVLPGITEPLYLNGATGDPLFPRVELSSVNDEQGQRDYGLYCPTNLSYLKSLVINGFIIGIHLTGTTGQGDRNVVEDCYLGLNASGTATGSVINTDGIWVVAGADFNRIGGNGLAQANVISGNFNAGIFIENSTNNSVTGNRIGTNAAGTGGVGNYIGVLIGDCSNNTITGNTIAYNNDAGIYASSVLAPVTGARFSQNRIFSNGGLGIDLAATTNFDHGVTPNDVGDGDNGVNRLQNFPVLNAITTAGTGTGSLDTLAANASFPIRIEFYANSLCDSSGNGEGEQFLTFLSLANAAAASNFTFNYTPVSGKPFISALAIDAAGNTSEFSACQTDTPCPTITLTAPPLPNGALATSYNQTLSASGGTAPYTFSVDSGVLPAGLTLDGNTGIISGAPSALGNSIFTIKAIAANGCTGTQIYTISVGCPAITLSSLPNGNVGLPYNQTVTANPLGLTYSYTLTGTLPTGLSFNNGVFSGIPVQTGTFSFTITASTSGGACSSSRTYTNVQFTCPSIAVTPATLSAATYGVAYGPVQFNAAGGFGNRTFGLATGSSLPNGITLTSAGVLSGTATQVGSFNFAVTVTDSLGCTGTVSLSLTVNCGTVTVLPAGLADAKLGLAYNQQLTHTGAPGPMSYTVTGGALPPGLSLSPAGALTGTPTGTTSSSSFTVRAAGGGCEGFKNYTLNVTCPGISLSDLAPAQSGQAYSQNITAPPSGGAYTFTLTGGTLPTGLNLNANGTLSGTPTQGGTYTFTITATGFGNACTGARTYTLTTNCPTITLQPNALPNVIVGTLYNQSLSATPANLTFTYAVTSGSLPAGLTLNANGLLSGTATAAGNYSFSVTATAFGNCTGTRSYNLLATSTCATVTLSTTTLPGGTLGANYNQTLTATPTGTYTFAVTNGTLPTGLSLNSNGTLSGNPTQTGNFSFRITATNESGCSGSRQYLVTIACGTLSFTPSSLPAGRIGTSYTQSILASPGSNYRYNVLVGQLPAGYTLSNTGLLSGITTQTGTFTFTVRAFSPGGCQGTKVYSLTITASAAAVRNDFDGDGRSDLLRWEAAEGRWLIGYSGDGSTQTVLFGEAGDVPVQADYDGDSKTDVAVYRPSNGTWYILRSSLGLNGQTFVKHWGVASDVPVPGDYDGDGKADLAVWRGGEGNWYILHSADQSQRIEPWGSSASPYQDLPIANDYDGDGRTDLAVFRRGPNHGQGGYWFIKLSRSNEVFTKPWGLGSDIPVVADYDGDGKADIAVWRGQQSDGVWYILRSTDQKPLIETWGSALPPYLDEPAFGDYDGDGKADLAVCRNAQIWHILQSANSTTITMQLIRP